MTDYEKLKAFAEELNPEFEFEKIYKHNGKYVIDSAYGDGQSLHISGRIEGRFSDNKNWNHLENLDEWIKETREYWREQGLPSLQNKNSRLIINQPRAYGKNMMYEYWEAWREQAKQAHIGIDFSLNTEDIKTNKKSIMKNIKDTLKALTHSKEDKALIKAELKTEDNTWTNEAYQYALSELVNERLDTKEFKEQMLKVAEERNKECK